MRDIELPPLPLDVAEMDRLLQETTVRALESKYGLPLVLNTSK